MKNQNKILIVEDDVESVDLLKYFLKPENYNIEVAINGKDALDVFRRFSPDLVILDVMLPEIDGFSICTTLKNNPETRHVPIIIMTALKELKDKIKALESGADDFITKPFDSLELLARVRSLLKAKNYFDDLQYSNEQLKEKNKILEKDDKLKKDLIQLIVHDMKNPLFVIQGNLQMMGMNDQFKSSPMQKYVYRIEKSSRNLLRMILNLLDISRLEQNTVELNISKTNLNEAITSKIDYFRKIGDIGEINLTVNIPESPIYSMLDHELFDRSIDNLLSFLVNNTKEGKSLKISLGVQNKIIKIAFFNEGNEIFDDYKSKVFLKHAQTELKKAGFRIAKGLGLIFCKSALNLMDADICIENNNEKGNLFMITCKEAK